MTPSTPIIPGADLPVTVFAANQKPYIPLPCYRAEDGAVLIRWRLTWRERIHLLLSGNLWHWVLTFNDPLQPIKLTTETPALAQSE